MKTPHKRLAPGPLQALIRRKLSSCSSCPNAFIRYRKPAGTFENSKYSNCRIGQSQLS